VQRQPTPRSRALGAAGRIDALITDRQTDGTEQNRTLVGENATLPPRAVINRPSAHGCEHNNDHYRESERETERGRESEREKEGERERERETDLSPSDREFVGLLGDVVITA